MRKNTVPSVNVRTAKMTKGRLSVYLDFYPAVRNPQTNRNTRREYLGFYIYENPTTQFQKEYNESILNRAELIRCRHQEQLINSEFGFLDRETPKLDFLAYFERKSKGRHQKWKCSYLHFRHFTKGNCTFGDITIDFCNKFRSYLLNANQMKHTKRKINRNSAAGYFSLFRALLKEAHKERLLKENLNDYLDQIDYEEVKKDFLTVDEVKKLAATECRLPGLKRASLFSILTGLRLSDILNLKWEDIRQDADGEISMFIRIQKTKKETCHPLSAEMLALCGERKTGKVFKDFQRHMTQRPLQEWLKAAGITKHITFHKFRDTFATLQLAAGTDIFTVSKLLDHANVTTTQIYAQLLPSAKRITTDRISLK